MSISSEISRISGNISDSLAAVAAKGVTVPSGSNSDDLAGLIELIAGGATIPDGDNLGYGGSSASSNIVGTGQAGYMII